MAQRPRRRFSKFLVALNVALCWVTVFAAVVWQQPEVAITGLTIIATIVGTYMGVGHLDYTRILTSLKGTPSYDAYNDPTVGAG